MKKTKVPILMYHEVLNKIEVERSVNQMTPSYFVSNDIFENQIKALVAKDYKSIFFDDVPTIDTDRRHIIITFDDGWLGSHRYVLPILSKHGFKAIFFVATDLIGTSGHMDWAEILDLKNRGMSIQSHAVTHKPLCTMDDYGVYLELSKSKKIIEDKTGSEVSAISFPHGSYNKAVVEIAGKAGYRVMCTSEVEKTYNTSFSKKPIVLGRITMVDGMGEEQFLKLIVFNQAEVLKKKITKGAKNCLKKIIGINNYRKLYRKYFNITDPETPA